MTQQYVAVGFIFVGAILVASLVVRFAANRYISRLKKEFSKSGTSGRELVERIAASEGLVFDLKEVNEEGTGNFRYEEDLVEIPGLEDDSLSTLGIAAHEVGHAVQAREHRDLLKTFVYLAEAGKYLSYLFPIISITGMIFYYPLLQVGLGIYATILLIVLAEIPLEVDASSKALFYLKSYGKSSEEELALLKKLLGLAILTRLTSLTVGFLALFYVNEEVRI